MSNLHTFSDLHAFSPQQIRQKFGGKAFGLYEASLLGIPIPMTLLVSTECHETFLKTTSEPVQFLRATLAPALDGLQEGLYAVRSSCQSEDAAHHSFAGIFETKLNVSKDQLCEAIARVWKSSHNARVESYTKAHALMGILIQPMIEAKFAGICFSRHPSPSTLFENGQIVVEFAATSGEKVVQGEVIPTRLSGTADILSSVSEHGWMDDLLKALFELKKWYHHEVDIEFVIDRQDNFWLLQQRPISKVIRSQTLDLSDYKRMYKRSLLSLDIELLIDGCARFLAPYFEIPLSLERWMVMTTRETQELWVDEILNETVLRSVIDLIEHDPAYLPRLEARYADCDRRLKGPQPMRLFEWFEWVTPFTAHYYAPMFVIEALYTLILREIRSIDPEMAERDLFDLAATGINSMVDLFNQELCLLKNLSFKECQPKLKELAREFGFMKCRQIFEEPYTPKELFELIAAAAAATPFDEKAFQLKKEKYFKQEHLIHRLNRLREWMRIRNQEMEHFYFALFSARPLINTICKTLSIDRETFWRSSKAALLEALDKEKPLTATPIQNLTIFQLDGKTHLSDRIEILLPNTERFSDLKGRTVYGKGILEASVKILFTPEEFQSPPERPCVLVTGMTTPDFVPLIRNHFDALLTDEGGILCHAAIVAREIPISCIVGTGCATTILKDGMRIRIDFATGEIELL